MARMSARAREEADEAAWEAEWEAMSEAEAGAEWKDAFARAAAGTERGMAEAAAAAANERLMAAQSAKRKAQSAKRKAQAQSQSQARALEEAEWEAKREDMVTHHARYGRLLTAYEDSGWVRTQRADYAAGTMSEERQDRLNALSFWKWKTEFDVFWADLAEHHVKHGCMPGQGDGYKFLKKQQKHYSRTMSEANKKKIAAFGGPVAAAILGGPPSAGQAGPRASAAREPREPREPSKIRRFPRPTDDGDVRGRQEWEWETKLRWVAWLYWEHGSMPKEGEEGFKWVAAQKKLIREGTMSKERMQRVREEGGVVAAAIMKRAPDQGPG